MITAGLVVCPDCSGYFNKIHYNRLFSVVKCTCNRYPVFLGIYYLKNDVVKNRVLSQINHQSWIPAVFTLLDVSRRTSAALILIAIPLSLLGKFLFRIIPRLNLHLKFFNLTVIFLRTFTGYNSSWANYLLKRTSIPSYHIGLAFQGLLKRHNIVADIGCGTGHLLSDINRRIIPKNLVCLDQAILQLVFAKLFFSHPDNILVCTDLNISLPLAKAKFDYLYSTDTFHNLKHKIFFLDSANLALKNTGHLALIHNHISSVDTINGISPSRLTNMLHTSGLKYSSAVSNEYLWSSLSKNKAQNINSKTNKLLPFSDIYHVVASKKQFNLSIKLDPSQSETLSRTSIFYHGDTNLSAKVKIIDLVKRFKNFYFLSPHLDDAVLSAGQFIYYLRQFGADVNIVTIFTRGTNPPLSPQAKIHLAESGFNDTFKFFTSRNKEERTALRFLDVRSIRLKYVDAAWRKISPQVFVYHDNASQFSGVLSSADQPLIRDIKNAILTHISDRDSTLVIGPLGIGLHPDHLLIRKVLESIELPYLYWLDQPYSGYSQPQVKRVIRAKKLTPLFLPPLTPTLIKKTAISKYSSQIRTLFPKGEILPLTEQFYLSPPNSRILL